MSQSVTLLAVQRRYTGPADPSNVISDEEVPDNWNIGSYGWVKPDGETVTIEKSESIGIGNGFFSKGDNQMEVKIVIENESKFKDIIEKELEAFSKEELHELVKAGVVQNLTEDKSG